MGEDRIQLYRLCSQYHTIWANMYELIFEATWTAEVLSVIVKRIFGLVYNNLNFKTFIKNCKIELFNFILNDVTKKY